MRDEIVLTLPREREFYDIAHLVVSGLAARLDLTLEHLEDLHVALAGLLPRGGEPGDVTVLLRRLAGSITAEVGPFARPELERRLGADGPGVSLARVLSAVTDGYSIEEREGGSWIVVTKAVADRA